MGAVDEAIRELRRWQNCPACGHPVRSGRCDGCGLLLAGEPVRLLIQQSEAAARALEQRQRTLAQLVAVSRPAVAGTRPVASPSPVVAGTSRPAPSDRPALPAGAPLAGPAPAAPPVPQPAPREVNPVAVFSAVGVGALVAAALVLAFLVPADPNLVELILAGVTLASGAATLALHRRRPVSAAAIAVGAALLCLLVIALFVRWLPAQQALLIAAMAVAGLAVGLGAAGFGLRLRPWVSSGILLAPISVALAAWSQLEDPWWLDGLLVLAVAVAAAGRWAARRWQGDQPGPLPFPVERALLGLGAAVTLLVAVAVGFALATGRPDPGAPAALLVLAAAGAAWLHGAKPDAGWRRTAGMVAVLAPPALVLGLRADGLAATATAGLGWIALAALSSLPPLRDGRWAGLLKGGWVAGLLLTLPAVGYLLEGMTAGSGWRLDDVYGFPRLMLGWDLPTAGYAAAGLLVAAAQCAVATALPAARFGRTADEAAPLPELEVTRLSGRLWPWLALAGLAAVAALPAWSLAVSVWLLLALALGGGLVAWRVGERHRSVRAAGRIGGALLIVGATLASWESRPLTLAAGAAAVLLTIGWTQLVPRAGRPLLAGLAYGYALTLLGYALHWYPLGWQPGEWTPVAGLLAVTASLVSLGVLATTPRLALPLARPDWLPRLPAAAAATDPAPSALRTPGGPGSARPPVSPCSASAWCRGRWPC
ncbi:MAG: zinc ribbon domain-containing protein [Propionicimonas sp.]